MLKIWLRYCIIKEVKILYHTMNILKVQMPTSITHHYSPVVDVSFFSFQFWYFTYGTKDVLERECKDLHKKLKVSKTLKIVV